MYFQVPDSGFGLKKAYKPLIYNIIRKVPKNSEFPRSISSAKLQTILAAFKWIDQGVLHRQTGFDKMTAKGVET